MPLVISNTHNCVIDIKSWMTTNMLQINMVKTEVLVLMNKSFRNPIGMNKIKFLQLIYQLQAASEILELYLRVL